MCIVICFKFVAAKFILNTTFAQLFIWYESTINKTLYSLYNVSKDKIYTVFRAKARTYSHKNVKLLVKKKFTIEETNCKQRNIPVAISL